MQKTFFNLYIFLYLYAYYMTSFCSSLLLISPSSFFSHSVIIDVFTQRDWDECQAAAPAPACLLCPWLIHFKYCNIDFIMSAVQACRIMIVITM